MDFSAILLKRNDIKSIHYLKRYINFVNHRLQYPPDKHTFTHSHHILPRKLYPEFENKSQFPDNIVILTAREHFIIHWMLWKAIDNSSMAFAFYAMKHRNNENLCSRTYANLMSVVSTQLSKMAKGRKWINNGTNSKFISSELVDEYIESGWSLGRLISEEHGKAISASLTGIKVPNRKISEEGKRKMSKGAKNRRQSKIPSLNPNAKPFQIDNICFLTLKYAQEHYNLSRRKTMKLGNFVVKEVI